MFLLVPRHLKQIHHSPISGKKETRFPMVPSHSGNSRNSITFRRDLWHLPWDSPVKLQGHLWRGHPKVGKYTGSDVSQERKKRDLARKVQAPKRENQKTRTPFAVVAFSRFRAFMCSMLAFSFFRFFGFSCFRVFVLSCVQCWRFRVFAFCRRHPRGRTHTSYAQDVSGFQTFMRREDLSFYCFFGCHLLLCLEQVLRSVSLHLFFVGWGKAKRREK